MAQRHIGFSILGQTQDSQGGDKESRWEKFRPSVAFATQEGVSLDCFVLAYQIGQEALRDRVIADIRHVHKERDSQRNYTCNIKSVPIAFDDPFDFGVVFRALFQALEMLGSEDPGCWHLSLATGTQPMHFAMYIMADKWLLPMQVHLVQPIPGERSSPSTYGSILRPMDVSWPELPGYRAVFDEKRREYVANLLPTGKTQNSDWYATLERLEHVGIETDEPLLLLGPTGTGKSYLAGRIHVLWAKQRVPSGRDAPFMEANCAAMKGSLAQSELFGHVKGAFTGAISDHAGLLKMANGGTLFLDELGEMDLETQAMLLKALETGKFSRVGEMGKTDESKFRLICATNHDLTADVAAGKFRLDLYARIRNWVFHLPALKELPEDMPSLITHAMHEWQKRNSVSGNRAAIEFDDQALEAFEKFAVTFGWPGNHRDLIQCVNRMATLSSLERYGGRGRIEIETVRNEIREMRQLWAEHAKVNKVTGKAVAVGEFAHHVRASCPDSSLMQAAEYTLQNWVLEEAKENKAEAGRMLYGVHGKVAGNPTSVFVRRRELVGRTIERREPK